MVLVQTRFQCSQWENDTKVDQIMHFHYPYTSYKSLVKVHWHFRCRKKSLFKQMHPIYVMKFKQCIMIWEVIHFLYIKNNSCII